MWNWVPITIAVNAPGAAGAAGAGIVELVGTNTIASVDPCPKRTCVYSAVDGVAGIINYCGMAVAPNFGTRGGLVVAGGGHSDYYGNEVYVFDLASSTWTRINSPSLAALPDNNPEVDLVHGEYSDGSPMAVHTYDVLRVIPGGTKGLLLLTVSPALPGSGGKSAGYSHVCDLATGVWSRYSTNAAPGGVNVANITCYDATNNRVWALPRGGFNNIFSYLDLGTKQHVSVKFGSTNAGYNPCAAQFPVHGLMLFVTGVYGTTAGLTLGAIDLSNPAAGMVTLTTIGDTVPQQPNPPWGFDWDTDNDVGYIFAGDGDPSHVHRVTPPPSGLLTSPWTLKKLTLSQSLPLNGGDNYAVYGRWRYVPTIRKFAYVSHVKNQVALYTPAAKGS